MALCVELQLRVVAGDTPRPAGYVDSSAEEPVCRPVTEGLIAQHLPFLPVANATASPDRLAATISHQQVETAENSDQDGELSAIQDGEVHRHSGLIYEPPTAPSGRRLARR